MSYTLTQELSPLAQHEAGHIVHAVLVGHLVTESHVSLEGGWTAIEQPVSPATLATRWQRSPLLWSCELAKILGGLYSGCVADHQPFGGRDAVASWEWSQAYVNHGIGTVSDFTLLYTTAWSVVRAWQRHGNVQSCIRTVGEQLAYCRDLTRYTIMDALTAGNISGIPTPAHWAVLPAARPIPRPGQLPSLRTIQVGGIGLISVDT